MILMYFLCMSDNTPESRFVFMRRVYRIFYFETTFYSISSLPFRGLCYIHILCFCILSIHSMRIPLGAEKLDGVSQICVCFYAMF